MKERHELVNYKDDVKDKHVDTDVDSWRLILEKFLKTIVNKTSNFELKNKLKCSAKINLFSKVISKKYILNSKIESTPNVMRSLKHGSHCSNHICCLEQGNLIASDQSLSPEHFHQLCIFNATLIVFYKMGFYSSLVQFFVFINNQFISY